MQFPLRTIAGAFSALAVLSGAAAAPSRAGVNPDFMLSPPAARIGPGAAMSPRQGGNLSPFRATSRTSLMRKGAPRMATKSASTRQTSQEPDLNGDGNLDILFQHNQNGTVYYWLTDGTQIIGQNFLWNGNIAGWRVISTVDLNRDGKPDVILRNENSGAVYYWMTNGTQIIADGFLTGGGDADWAPVRIADLNGTSQRDVLVANRDTGGLYYWVLSNTGRSIATHGFLLTSEDANDGIDAPWQVVGTPDLNRDGRLDVVRRNRNTGGVEYILLGAAGGLPTMTARGLLWEGGDANWSVRSTPDLNRDGTPDLLFQYAGSDAVVYWLLNAGGTSIMSAGFLSTGDEDPATSWRIVATRDLNADTQPDILLQDSGSGAVFFWLLTNNGTSVGTSGFLWQGGDRAWVAIKVSDLNRDGVGDLIFRRNGTNTDPNRGAIYYWLLNTNPSIAGQNFLWNGGDASWEPVAFYPD